MIEQTYGHLLRTYQEQEMKKFSFFHPTNGSKSEGNGDKITEQIQPRITPGSPEGAPEERTGVENKCSGNNPASPIC